MSELEQAANNLYQVCEKIAMFQDEEEREKYLLILGSLKLSLKKPAKITVERGLSSLKLLYSFYAPIVPLQEENAFTEAYSSTRTAVINHLKSQLKSNDTLADHPSYGAGHQRFIDSLGLEDIELNYIEPVDDSSYEGYLEEPKF